MIYSKSWVNSRRSFTWNSDLASVWFPSTMVVLIRNTYCKSRQETFPSQHAHFYRWLGIAVGRRPNESK